MNKNTIANIEELSQCLLPTIPLQSSFQPEPSICNRQSVILEDDQVPHEDQDKLASLLQTKLNSTVSKLLKDVGRTDFFEMDIPTTGTLIVHNSTSFH